MRTVLVAGHHCVARLPESTQIRTEVISGAGGAAAWTGGGVEAESVRVGALTRSRPDVVCTAASGAVGGGEAGVVRVCVGGVSGCTSASGAAGVGPFSVPPR